MANVLPPEDQKIIMRTQIARFVLVFSAVALICACATYLALTPSYLTLVFGDVKVQSNLGGHASTTSDASVMRETKATITQLNSITSATSSASQILSAIISEKPEGVTISELNFTSGSPGKIVIVARAARLNLIQTYRDTLKADAHFESVNIPVSALVGSANDNFTITLSGTF